MSAIHCPAQHPHCRHEKEEGRCDYCGFDFEPPHITAESLEVAKQEAAHIARQKAQAEELAATHTQELEQLRAQLSAAENRITRLNREIEQTGEESARLRGELERTQGTANELKKQLTAEENKTRQLQQELNQTRSSRDTMESALKEAQQKLEVAQKQVQEKAQKLEQLEKSLNHESDLKRAREKERDDAARKRDELARELTEVQGQYAQAAQEAQAHKDRAGKAERSLGTVNASRKAWIIGLMLLGAIGVWVGYVNGRENPYLEEAPAPEAAAPAPANAAPPDFGIQMVRIPADCFIMGSPESEVGRDDNEGPQHQVCVQAFDMGMTEVTQGQWQALMGSNPSHFKACGADCPVEQVSWDDAQAFIRELNKKTRGGYRLPSEAEWEYAARAGTTGPFSFSGPITAEKANYDANYQYEGSPKGRYREKTVEVGSLPANPWGLYEMHGNVWEWVQDCWHDSYKGNPPTDGSAWETGCTEDGRVLRGGSWSGIPRSLRSAIRNWLTPDIRDFIVGFRLARTLP